MRGKCNKNTNGKSRQIDRLYRYTRQQDINAIEVLRETACDAVVLQQQAIRGETVKTLLTLLKRPAGKKIGLYANLY